MNVISFDAKLWKNGNSLLLTIPKNIREEYNLDENDIIRVKAGVTTKEDIEREKELKKNQLMYPHVAKGTLIHKTEVVAHLDVVRFRINEEHTGKFGADVSEEVLETYKTLRGIIIAGRFTPEASSEKHYNDPPFDNDFKRNLNTTETIRLKSNNGDEIILEHIYFDNPIVKGDKLGSIEVVRFHSHCLTINPQKKTKP